MAKDSRAPDLIASTAVLLALSAITVALRSYVRTVLLKAFRLEDWLALVTLFTFTLYSACIFASVSHDAGKHLGEASRPDLPYAVKTRYLGEIAYVITATFLKFTVGLFLLRICSRPWQRLTIWTVLVVVLIFNIIYLFMAMFQCRPVEYYWLRFTHEIEGQCLDKAVITGATYASTAFNAWADWTLGLLPLALVWKLELGKRTKASVAGILALGILSSTATLIRIPYIWQLTHDDDLLYVFADFTIWSTIEIGIGITASSIATLRPLFKKFLSKSRLGTYPLPRHSVRTPRPGLKLPTVVDSFPEQEEIPMAPVAHVRDRVVRPDLEAGLCAPLASDVYDAVDEWRTSSRATPVSVRRMH